MKEKRFLELYFPTKLDGQQFGSRLYQGTKKYKGFEVFDWRLEYEEHMEDVYRWSVSNEYLPYKITCWVHFEKNEEVNTWMDNIEKAHGVVKWEGRLE